MRTIDDLCDRAQSSDVCALRENIRERIRRTNSPPSSHAVRTEPDRPDEQLERLETMSALIAAMRGLSREKRDVVEMRFFEGLMPRAIASRLAVPVETVKTRLKRALAELRREVADMALGAAGAILNAELDADRNRKLADDFIADLPDAN